MSDITTKTWIELEKPSFRNFNEFIAVRLEDGIFRSIAEKMKNALQATGSVKLELPWGTYSAEAKDVGEGGNITPVFEPKKSFMNMMNDDSTENKEKNHQEEFDPEFIQLFCDYVAYGEFYPGTDGTGNKDKGIKMREDECDYFLNNFGLVIAKIANDKARDGKLYRLEINNGFPHGSFDFEYDGDGIVSMKFVPHKIFKQYLKDDEVAKRAQQASFVSFKHPEVKRETNLEYVAMQLNLGAMSHSGRDTNVDDFYKLIKRKKNKKHKKN